MKNTDKTYIEKLALKLIEARSAYITIDRDDYEFTKGRFGEPSVAIETGLCDSVGLLIEALKKELEEEDTSTIRTVIACLTTSRDNGMRMIDIQEIDNVLKCNLPKDIHFLRSISFNQEDGKHSATLIVWK